MTTKTEIAALVGRMRLLCAAIENSPRWTWERDQGMAADIRTLLSLVAERERMREALEFYADPETYHACAFLFDRPTGGFDEDFDEDHGHEDYPRAMPGKLARAALAPVSKEPENG